METRLPTHVPPIHRQSRVVHALRRAGPSLRYRCLITRRTYGSHWVRSVSRSFGVLTHMTCVHHCILRGSLAPRNPLFSTYSPLCPPAPDPTDPSTVSDHLSSPERRTFGIILPFQTGCLRLVIALEAPPRPLLADGRVSLELGSSVPCLHGHFTHSPTSA